MPRCIADLTDDEGDVLTLESIGDTLFLSAQAEDGEALFAFDADKVQKLRDLCEAHLAALKSQQG